MKSEICVLEEPKLVFGDGNKLTDPHAGLSLFGPYDKGEQGRPHEVSYALIGCTSGLRSFKDFVRLLNGPLFHEKLQGEDVNIDIGRLWPPYPGFATAFECDLPEHTRFEYEITEDEIMTNVNDIDQHKRVFKIVNLYLDKIKMIAERDENIKVVICIEPDLIWKNCRPKSVIRKEDATGTRVTKKEVTELMTRIYNPININEYCKWLSNKFRKLITKTKKYLTEEPSLRNEYINDEHLDTFIIENSFIFSPIELRHNFYSKYIGDTKPPEKFNQMVGWNTETFIHVYTLIVTERSKMKVSG